MLFLLGVNYKHELSDYEAELWTKSLLEFDPRDVESVITRHMRSEGKFFPTIGEIIAPLEAMKAERHRQEQIRLEAERRRDLERRRAAGEFVPMPEEEAQRFLDLVKEKAMKIQEQRTTRAITRRQAWQERKKVLDGLEFLLQLRTRAREEGWISCAGK